MANASGKDLKPEYSYSALIAAAFRPEYVASTDLFEGYTQTETNFGLIWGLSIQAYESTLVADDSRVDQFLAGNTSALTALEQQGLNKFAAVVLNARNGKSAASISAQNIQRVSNRVPRHNRNADTAMMAITCLVPPSRDKQIYKRNVGRRDVSWKVIQPIQPFDLDTGSSIDQEAENSVYSNRVVDTLMLHIRLTQDDHGRAFLASKSASIAAVVTGWWAAIYLP
jgi:hypothetical protein